MLKCGVPNAPQSRTHNARNISVPRELVMSPRSMILAGFQPNHSLSQPATLPFAAASLPQMNRSCSPGTREGAIMISQFTVFSALTTRVSGNSR